MSLVIVTLLSILLVLVALEANRIYIRYKTDKYLYAAIKPLVEKFLNRGVKSWVM